MKIYDKASWHIDAGENKEEVIKKFNIIFKKLFIKNMLTEEGKEVYEFALDESVSIHEKLLTEEGKKFIENEYDRLINLPSNELIKVL